MSFFVVKRPEKISKNRGSIAIPVYEDKDGIIITHNYNKDEFKKMIENDEPISYIANHNNIIMLTLARSTLIGLNERNTLAPGYAEFSRLFARVDEEGLLVQTCISFFEIDLG